MTRRLASLAFACAAMAVAGVAPSLAAQPIPVTQENFVRAETDMYFSIEAAEGALGTLLHRRELVPIDRQTVVRSDRDTLYSSGVFDLAAGPVTVTMPDPGQRFMSLMAIDEDHYVVLVAYGAGSHTFTREQVGTRYLFLAVRTLIDPAKAGDLVTAHALQDAIRIQQKARGRLQVPDWDKVSQKEVRDALIVLKSTLPDMRNAFGRRGEVDPLLHLVGTATGWGGNPERDATYLSVTPAKNDGRTIHRLSVQDVPVDGFWSVSVYNAEGFFVPNPLNAYSLNNLTAVPSDTGTVTIQFGGCTAEVENCLPTPPGWNYLVRLYRPREEILDGSWKFPDAQPVP